MAKFRFNEKTDSLFMAILSLRTVEEAEAFFRDLCTIEEIKEMAERWQIAQLVNQDLPYREIAQKLRASTTTVARVASWLNNGMGGYRLVLNRQNAHHHLSRVSRKG